MTLAWERSIAAVASLSITALMFAWLTSLTPRLRAPASEPASLQVVWIHRVRQPAAAPTPPPPASVRGKSPSPISTVFPPKALPSANAQPESAKAPRTLDLRLPETRAISFAPDPMRPPPRDLSVQHLPRFAVRGASFEAMGIARDCAELRAALVKGADARVILRSMEARGCTF